MAKINPRQARRFAQALGQIAKTDQIDARMGVALAIEPRPTNSKIIHELKKLHIARQALIKDSTVTKNRAHMLILRVLKKQNEQHLAQIERQLEAIEADIPARIKADANLIPSSIDRNRSIEDGKRKCAP